MKHTLTILLLAFACGKPVPKNAPQVAQCLVDKGVKMYGAFWCPHCRAQKEAFGDAYPQDAYVECSHEDRAQKEECGGAPRYFICEPKTSDDRARCIVDCQNSGTCRAFPQRYEQCEDKAGDEKVKCAEACSTSKDCTSLETLYFECEPKTAAERKTCNDECAASGTCEHIGRPLYRECQTADDQAACLDACDAGGGCTRIDIRGYPTWIFPDGTRLSGEQSIQTLAEKAGC